MPIISARLGWTLLLSILLHAALIEAFTRLDLSRRREAPATALDVRMRETPEQLKIPTPDPVASIAPRLQLPKPTQANASAAQPVVAARRENASRSLSGEAARIAHVQLSRVLLYPREAIEQGIEGEATVLLFLDETGNAIAARLEASSGNALLDDAAVAAARTLRGLPGGAPREALLPVRFRLR